MNNNKLVILQTKDDVNGYEIDKMSNFIENYYSYFIESMGKISINTSTVTANLENIGIINDAISGTIKTLKNGTTLIPDFEHLPKDIKLKLKKGLYKIGESKQVNGNYRPVILDENGVRVKDITLKKPVMEENSLFAIDNIKNLIQLKRINENLETIHELQYYQITRARDSAVLVPFFDARDLIQKAQTSENFIKRQEYLEMASLKLDHAFNETAMELETSKNFLINNSTKIFKGQSKINVFIEHMSEDVQLLTMICGIKIHISDYLGLSNESRNAFEKYKNFMMKFANDRNNKMKITGFELMHDNCIYDKNNTDLWFKFSNKLVDNLSSKELDKIEEVLLVGMEDIPSEG